MMLRIAGEIADGTILAWAGPKTIATHYVPKINAAARSGRQAPAPGLRAAARRGNR